MIREVRYVHDQAHPERPCEGGAAGQALRARAADVRLPPGGDLSSAPWRGRRRKWRPTGAARIARPSSPRLAHRLSPPRHPQVSLKRLLLDVNVVLDVLLERSQHSERAAALWALIETGKATGLLSADAVTIVHYLVAHEHDRRRARHAIDRLLSVFTVAAVDDPVIRS